MGWSWYDDHIVIVFFSSRSLPFLSLFYSQLGSDFCQAHSVAIAIQVPSWMLLTSTTELWRPKQNREIPSIRTRVLDIAKTFAYLGGDFSFKQFETLYWIWYGFPQAFEASASSSGGRQSVNDKELSITVTKSQKKVKVKRYKKNWGTPQLSKRVETEMTI